MSNDQTDQVIDPVEPQETNLEDFSKELFGESNKEEPKVEAEPEQDNAPTEVDTQSSEEPEADDVSEDDPTLEDDDTLAPEDDDSDDDPEAKEEPEQPKKKKNSFQERIDEINGKYREEERQRIADRREFEARIQELESKLGNNKEPENTSTESVESVTAPTPNDKNEDGSDKYPLGDLDPAYMKDTVQHMLDADKAARKAEALKEQQSQAVQAEKNELQESWNTKLNDAQERYPDFQEKGKEMISVFDGIDEQYGDYLSTTIMDMENGPDVFYHLSNNLEEAERIVNLGARKATIELAKIEARMAVQKEVKPPKVSKAPAPPPRVKGSSVAAPAIKPDTNDLDEFSKLMFKS